MVRTQIQLPDPLYRKLKRIAKERDWSLAEVVRRSAERFVERFPDEGEAPATWVFPTIEPAEDFLADPALHPPEVDAVLVRSST